MSRRAAWNTSDGKQAAIKEPLHSHIFKGIEFDAFRKSAPFTRHGRRGVMDDTIGRKTEGSIPPNRGQEI